MKKRATKKTTKKTSKRMTQNLEDQEDIKLEDINDIINDELTIGEVKIHKKELELLSDKWPYEYQKINSLKVGGAVFFPLESKLKRDYKANFKVIIRALHKDTKKRYQFKNIDENMGAYVRLPNGAKIWGGHDKNKKVKKEE